MKVCGREQLVCHTGEQETGIAPEVNLKECVTCTPVPSVNKAANSGFETQRRHQQKSKARVSVAQKRTYVLQKF